MAGTPMFINELEVFPYNGVDGRTFCYQPPLPVVKKDRDHTGGGFDDALPQGIVGVLAKVTWVFETWLRRPRSL
jgi:hypothetical protein